jgi:hypothetical protein
MTLPTRPMFTLVQITQLKNDLKRLRHAIEKACREKYGICTLQNALAREFEYTDFSTLRLNSTPIEHAPFDLLTRLSAVELLAIFGKENASEKVAALDALNTRETKPKQPTIAYDALCLLLSDDVLDHYRHSSREPLHQEIRVSDQSRFFRDLAPGDHFVVTRLFGADRHYTVMSKGPIMGGKCAGVNCLNINAGLWAEANNGGFCSGHDVPGSHTCLTVDRATLNLKTLSIDGSTIHGTLCCEGKGTQVLRRECLLRFSLVNGRTHIDYIVSEGVAIRTKFSDQTLASLALRIDEAR